MDGKRRSKTTSKSNRNESKATCTGSRASSLMSIEFITNNPISCSSSPLDQTQSTNQVIDVEMRDMILETFMKYLPTAKSTRAPRKPDFAAMRREVMAAFQAVVQDRAVQDEYTRNRLFSLCNNTRTPFANSELVDDASNLRKTVQQLSDSAGVDLKALSNAQASAPGASAGASASRGNDPNKSNLQHSLQNLDQVETTLTDHLQFVLSFFVDNDDEELRNRVKLTAQMATDANRRDILATFHGAKGSSTRLNFTQAQDTKHMQPSLTNEQQVTRNPIPAAAASIANEKAKRTAEPWDSWLDSASDTSSVDETFESIN